MVFKSGGLSSLVWFPSQVSWSPENQGCRSSFLHSKSQKREEQKRRPRGSALQLWGVGEFPRSNTQTFRRSGVSGCTAVMICFALLLFSFKASDCSARGGFTTLSHWYPRWNSWLTDRDASESFMQFLFPIYIVTRVVLGFITSNFWLGTLLSRLSIGKPLHFHS